MCCFEVRDKQNVSNLSVQTQETLHFEDTKRVLFYIDILHLIHQTWQKMHLYPNKAQKLQTDIEKSSPWILFVFWNTESINLSVNLAIKSLEAEVREHR